MKKRRVNTAQRNFTLVCSLFVFVIMLLILLLFSAGTMILQYTGLSQYVDNTSAIPFIFCAIASAIIASCVTPLILRIPLSPVNRLIASMRKLASGDFSERIDLGNSTVGRELTDSFNTLASELENTELLRTDFINSFSHEFKTPIVSIRGFAKLCQRPDLPQEQRQAYLDIIVSESTRLSNMATNVLHLSKLENQQILTDVTAFNLSEQVRRCVLLLEKDWSARELTIKAGFGEFTIAANKELLGQVWLNLLSNAIKFSPVGAAITLRIFHRADVVAGDSMLQVDVINHGPAIPPEHQARLFDKFWQGDPSHASEGAGIGLTIAQKIVQLHQGQILLDSTEERTIFTVLLPAKY